jgi:hypothetical protein
MISGRVQVGDVLIAVSNRVFSPAVSPLVLNSMSL